LDGSFPGNGKLKQTPEQERIAERKLKDAELERDILKAIGIFPKRSMIYVFIKNNEKIFPIEKMCKVLQVGRYYQWKSQSVSDRKQRVVLVKEKITSIYFESKQRYGSPE
jgi:hypothetical protein